MNFLKFQRNFSKTAETSFTMRDRSDHDPRMIRAWNGQSAARLATEITFVLATSISYWKIQGFALRLSFQISPNAAPATKSDTATSPNTAPATQNDSHDCSAPLVNRYLQCAEQQRCLSNIAKYCACHANWLAWLSRVTYETLFTMRGATEVTLQHHQILRLPRKVTLELHFSTILYWTLYSALLYSSLPYYSLLYSTPLYSTLLYESILLRIDSLTQLFSDESILLRYSSLPYTIRYSTLLHSTLLYSSLRIYSLTKLVSNESIRIYSLTNRFSYESILRRIYSLTNRFSYESILLRIYSQTNVSYESILRRIYSLTNLFSYSAISFVYRKFLV